QEARALPGSSTLEAFDQFAAAFSDSGEFLNALVSDTNDQALALREALIASGTPSAVSSAEAQPSTETSAPVDPRAAMIALRSATFGNFSSAERSPIMAACGSTGAEVAGER